MGKHLFCMSVNFAYSGMEYKEVVELPDDMTEEEIEEEFENWIWDQIDAYREKLTE